jgi:hypothetical protein
VHHPDMQKTGCVSPWQLPIVVSSRRVSVTSVHLIVKTDLVKLDARKGLGLSTFQLLQAGALRSRLGSVRGALWHTSDGEMLQML